MAIDTDPQSDIEWSLQLEGVGHTSVNFNNRLRWTTKEMDVCGERKQRPSEDQRRWE